jgi:hypothetical protein
MGMKSAVALSTEFSRSTNRLQSVKSGPHRVAVYELVRKFFSPFCLLKDATVGTAAERSAAYHHNRRVRHCLPRYILRWLAACGIAILMANYFEMLGSQPGSFWLFTVLAAAQAIAAAVGFCVVLVFAYAYLYLSAHDH